MLFICLIILDILEFVTTLHHGKFWKEEKKGKGQSIYILWSSTLMAIDFDHTSQLLAKTSIILSIPKWLQQFEQKSQSVAIHNSKERTFKSGLNQV